jgi:hypothetical protein
MDADMFKYLTKQMLAECARVMDAKQTEYAPSGDRLEHFKSAAAEQGISPKTALWGMASKHVTSLSRMCRESEGDIRLWREKITDAVNYLILLWALACEENEARDGQD